MKAQTNMPMNFLFVIIKIWKPKSVPAAKKTIRMRKLEINFAIR